MVQRRPSRGRPMWTERPPRPDDDEAVEIPDPNEITTADPAYDHIVAAAHELAAFKIDLPREELQRLAIAKGRADYERDSRTPVQQRRCVHAATAGPGLSRYIESSVVYYMRIGNRVKIGFSRDVAKRMAGIGPEELMAVEPGGPHQERTRHEQFQALRVQGEWFRLESPLTEHIAALQKRFQRGT